MQLRGRVERAIIAALSPKSTRDPRSGRSVAMLARPVFDIREPPTPAQRASLARALGHLRAKGLVEQQWRIGKEWWWQLTERAWSAAQKERQHRAGEARRQNGQRRRERKEEAARARAAYEEAARRARAEEAASTSRGRQRPDTSRLRKLAALALSSPEPHEREAARLKVEQEMKRQRLTWEDLL